jgi:hemerythrin-like domain-containing protein
MDRHDSPGVRETRVVHEVHRRASTLLVDVLERPVPPVAAADFCDFVVAMLEHHHASEDQDLWPMLAARAPHLEGALRDLTGEHDQLQAGLDHLGALRIGARPVDGVEAAEGPDIALARDRARAVTALLHDHLAHEEPVLFPALDRHVTDKDWRMSAAARRSAPQGARHNEP